MADKFFEEKEENNEQETDKIKLGETEFTQDELNELVGAGRKLKEIESKQGQPIEEVLKSWGKRGERLGEWKKATGAQKPDEYLAKISEEKNKSPEQLSREEMKAKVLAEAREYGILTKEDLQVDNFLTKQDYEKIRSGEKTLNAVRTTIKKNVRMGYPAVKDEDLLKFMSDPKNPGDPKNAYKIMFEKEIKEVDMKKLNTLKGKPIYTDSKQTAGGKEFTPKKPTNLEGLREAMKVHMNSGE
jgi:hypothetical protein